MKDSNVKVQDYGKEFSVGISVYNQDFYWLSNNEIYEFYFIEDIYSYLITGKLIFYDRYSIFEFGSLVGGILINIVFGVDKDLTLTFQVYKSDRIIPETSHRNEMSENVIELTLVESNFRYLVQQKYSRSWRNKNITSIVSDILKNMVFIESEQQNIVDQSSESIDFCMPYWTPQQSINWLLLRASSNNKWGYCCYTKTKADHRSYAILEIQTLENMLSSDNILSDKNDGVYRMVTPDLYNFNRILSYEVSGTDMFSNKQLRGGHVLGYDFKRKKLIDKKFQYSPGSNYFNKESGEDVVDNFTMLGDWTLLSGTEYSLFNDTDVNSEIIGENNETIIKNIYFNDWIKRYCMQNTVNIVVRGHEDRELGKLIWIEWPSSSKDEVYNANMNGLYLIKSITHHFSPKGKPAYKQKVGLIRNAYNYDEISKRLLYPSNKINTTQPTGIIVT